MGLKRSDYVDRVRRLVGDPLQEKVRYPDEFLSDSLDAALDAISDYVGDVQIVEIAADEEEQVFFQLPANFLRVRRAALDSNSATMWLGEMVTRAGEYASDYENRYLVYEDQLYFPPGLTSDDTIVLHYEARWEWPTAEGDNIEFPGWFQRAVPFYAAYYLLANPVARFSVETQWKTRQDVSVDNPAVQGADWFLAQFHKVCRDHLAREVT